MHHELKRNKDLMKTNNCQVTNLIGFGPDLRYETLGIRSLGANIDVAIRDKL